jgi:antitoxin (DNA-binding transcriptional repressor) of toxin-antitoxin stability system
MKTATVRDLRTKFPVLARWMGDGEAIEITRRGRVIAHLTPAAGGSNAGRLVKPDIVKRLRKIYGDYVMPEEEAHWILDHNKGRY